MSSNAPSASDITDVLAEIDFFADATTADLRALAAAATRHDMVRNDVLFDEDDEPDTLYVVLSGRIAIVKHSESDDRESVIALMEPGDLFGELGMLDDQPRSATGRALEASTVMTIPYTPVRELFAARPELVWNAARLLARRLRTMDGVLADSVFLDVTGRTAKRLIEMSEGADEFALPVTQEELAGMVGASRERVNKAISSFVRLGWLEQHDRRYRIVQRDRLEQRAR
ncbi:MAG: Crp/Fnr family transcriptional regulator [Actinomycetota bacterium]|nr:Crp/Fnr family transcriptional regulator [Actinomycetota bacterium]MDA3007495.1 Crp/Fnr family transcriptional regulator [Actinomycetota bacterium]MDA3034590.1 Crp/Fnr family transcriptional regulator [Actinomycetota bacterium]